MRNDHYIDFYTYLKNMALGNLRVFIIACLLHLPCFKAIETLYDSQLPCDRTCYRSIDGSCNNLKHPKWGTPYTEYSRLFDVYSYEDGLCAMANLTNAREISLQGFVSVDGTEDPKWTLLTLEWGQPVVHDMALTAGVPVPGDTEGDGCDCVDGKYTGKPSTNQRCASIIIPKNDPYNTPEGNVCMDFVRTLSTCNLNPKQPGQQYNRVNSFLDGSTVYGNNEKETNELRLFENGKLKYQIRNGRIYPPQAKNIDDVCFPHPKPKNNLCIHAGDARANQNPYLGMFHITMFRYHNLIAETLCIRINPHWSDEKCFQETRRIIIAIIQHITYYDFLPILLGRENMIKKNIILSTPYGYHNVYDENIDPSTINEHSTVAFRVLHGGVQGYMKKYAENRKQQGTVRLSDWYDNLSLMLEGNTESELARGFSIQHQLKLDRFYDAEITQELFRGDALLGEDLFAIDVHRARDHGIAPYVVAVEKCGLGTLKSFKDFEKYIPKEYVELLQRMYDRYDQVDLRVAGTLETSLPGAITGPTFICIMLEQFYRTKFGDYFFYENGNQKYPFKTAQLDSIRKGATISSILCKTIDGIKYIQRDGFQKSSYSNPIVSCKDLPTLDLQLWKEDRLNYNSQC